MHESELSGLKSTRRTAIQPFPENATFMAASESASTRESETETAGK
jgi:hypothetical protein